MLWDGGRPLVKVGEFVSGGWDDVVKQERRLDLAETFRTLYVGLTRAEDHLLVSLHHKAASDPDKAKSHAGRLWKHRDALVEAGAEVSGKSRSNAALTTDTISGRERKFWTSAVSPERYRSLTSSYRRTSPGGTGRSTASGRRRRTGGRGRRRPHPGAPRSGT